MFLKWIGIIAFTVLSLCVFTAYRYFLSWLSYADLLASINMYHTNIYLVISLLGAT